MSGLFIMKPICCGVCSSGNYDLTGLSGGRLKLGIHPYIPSMRCYPYEDPQNRTSQQLLKESLRS